ncbi:MAG: hypothetical protein WD342_10710 [Verrucomicrobiales bacterium]
MAAFLTQATVWLAMLAWTIAILGRLERWSWTAGLGFYLWHILGAYHSHYRWSHDVAVAETARQTGELVGWESGIGIWINYAFAAVLAFDLLVQWTGRPRKFPRTVEALVLFMIVNGAIVFGSGPVRIFGAALSAAIVAGWFVRARENSSGSSSLPR